MAFIILIKANFFIFYYLLFYSFNLRNLKGLLYLIQYEIRFIVKWFFFNQSSIL